MTGKKSYNPTPNFVLGPESDAEPIPQSVLDDLGATVEWIEAGVDDLRVGDVIAIRQCLPVARGRGSHGQTIWETTSGYNHRQVKVRKEYRAVAEVLRVYQKRTRAAGRTVLMVQYGVMWDSNHDKLERISNAIGQPKIIEENAKPIGRRQLEVRRLRGSGPTREERRQVDAETHSRLARAAMFRSLWEEVQTAAVILNGNPFVDADKRENVEMEDVEKWLSGAVDVPAWVMNTLIRERDNVETGALPASLAKIEDTPPIDHERHAPKAVEGSVAVETPIIEEPKLDPLDVIEASPKPTHLEGSFRDHLDAARARMRAIAENETSFMVDPESEMDDEASDWEDAA